MKKIKNILIALLLMAMPLISYSAKDGVISDLEASYDNECGENDATCNLVVSGKIQGGLAVTIIAYNDTETEIVSMITASTTDPDEGNYKLFNETLALPHKNYVIKVADYDGGDYETVLVSDGGFTITEAEEDVQNNTLASDLDKALHGEDNFDNIYEMDDEKEGFLSHEDFSDYQIVYEEENLSTALNKTAEAVASAEQLQTIANKAGTNEIKYAALYEVSLLIDEEEVGVIGKILQLKTPMTMALDLPDSIKDVPSGYERVYKVILTHTDENGETTRYIIDDVTVKNGKVYFKNDKFSKFFIVYYDKAIPVEEEEDEDITLTNAYGYIKLSWEEAETGKGYLVYRKVSGGKYSLVKTITDIEKTTYKDTNVKKGVTYYYKVRNYKVKSGKTVKLDAYTVVSGKLKTVPSTNAEIYKAYKTKIKITWDKVKGSGYQVYRATSKSGKYTLVKTITSNSTTSYVDRNLKSGKTYYYKVRAYKTISGSNRNYGSFTKVSAKTTK